jgi:hydrogenase expression/formation protein HypC
MCIGIPMQVVSVEPSFANCRGRHEARRVSTLLVGPCAPGDWLLVFLNDARERIGAERAAEVDATLELLRRVMDGESGADPAGFALPSAMSAADLAALSGQTAPQTKS